MIYNATKLALISICLTLACNSDSEADSSIFNSAENGDGNNQVVVTTLTIGNIGSNTAQGGGSIVTSGSGMVNSRGLVWSQNGTPTLSDNDGISDDGSGPGSFTSSLTGLSSSTLYYVRAYATNDAGTAYGQIESFTTLEIPIPLLELVDSSIYINQIIDGVNVSREVLLEVPNIVDPSIDYPIVFAFHGRNVQNDTWINKLNHLTASGAFVGVYPQGHNLMWNSGGNENTTADDVEFVNAILIALEDYQNLDFERVYAIGTSNGSSMTNKLALETSHFNAVSTIVSQLTTFNLPNSNTNPTAVFQVNGAADTTIPIDGGPKLGYVFLEALESAQQWANAFECDDYQLQNQGADQLYIFSNCLDAKEVRYLRIENGEHNLHWGNPQLFTDIWDFLKDF
ncbi:MAG: hypothetical protein VXX60_05670 [Bacteroidota bacterium]|nr:hypothetical protein [Bacteroidota bacterium]